ncbi:branched-chain amino acid transport system II carrier protein [Clostridium acetireducens]|uniref:branched-chain amino acid transport system II carrier protein n=1 Tax=Clostridium acetireducens TaxID=76489 RepID=UPI00087301F3
MMKKSTNDAIVVGFALFSMFFGAGNLIFPPFLGKTVGTHYLIAVFAFVLTAAGLPLMGVLACAKCNGIFPDMAARVGKKFSVISSIILVIAIGPLLAVPRTASTTFELSIRPFFPGASRLVSVTIYFIITYALLYNQSSIVDTIGKILTPGLLVLLIVMIVKGIVSPMGNVIDTNATGVFPMSFVQGYQTMDAMTVTILSSLILGSFRDKGYKTYNDILKMTSKAGVIAVGGLAIIYGGLTVLGSQLSGIFPGKIERTELVVEISRRTLGNFGAVALAIVVALACLTTAIGITAASAQYFTKLSNYKIPYKVNAAVLSFASIIVASMGVDNIVAFADPILQVLYPITMIFIITTLMGKLIPDNRIVALTIYVVLIVSFSSVVVSPTGINADIPALKAFLDALPLSSAGFAWLVPAIIALIVGKMIFKRNDLVDHSVTAEE